jgi:hypothetical protein
MLHKGYDRKGLVKENLLVVILKGLGAKMN